MSPRDHKSIEHAQSPVFPGLELQGENAGTRSGTNLASPAITSQPAAGGASFGNDQDQQTDASRDCDPSARQPAPPASPLSGAGGVLPSAGMLAILDKRLEHFAAGYTPDRDAQGPDCFLENAANRYLYNAKLTRTKGNDLASLIAARAKYVAAAALLLAAIDRIDFLEQSQGHQND